jgi:transcriptional regulator
MWVPERYKIKNNNLIYEFIREVSLATLVSIDNNYPMATHTPMELETADDGSFVLRGHIAKQNPHGELLKSSPPVLAIFLSPVNHYISSSWYEKPNAPTYNYMSVHVYGRAQEITGHDLWESVKRLVDKHEKISRQPVSLAAMPKGIQGMLKDVTGFEIAIDNIEASFKLSQNRNEKDYQNIITELKKLNTPLANLMAEELINKKL